MAISRRQFMAAGAALAGTAAIAGLSGCGADNSSTDGDSTKADSGELYVYNWGEYIDEDVVSLFEEETTLRVQGVSTLARPVPPSSATLAV